MGSNPIITDILDILHGVVHVFLKNKLYYSHGQTRTN